MVRIKKTAWVTPAILTAILSACATEADGSGGTEAEEAARRADPPATAAFAANLPEGATSLPDWVGTDDLALTEEEMEAIQLGTVAARKSGEQVDHVLFRTSFHCQYFPDEGVARVVVDRPKCFAWR